MYDFRQVINKGRSGKPLLHTYCNVAGVVASMFQVLGSLIDPNINLLPVPDRYTPPPGHLFRLLAG